MNCKVSLQLSLSDNQFQKKLKIQGARQKTGAADISGTTVHVCAQYFNHTIKIQQWKSHSIVLYSVCILSFLSLYSKSVYKS